MQLCTIDPLVDSRWDELVASHPEASVFHQTGWLRALGVTYGYRPLVLTSASAGKQLSDGIVFCEVKSWITGRRLVSVPFADHTAPLLCAPGSFPQFTEWLLAERHRHHWKYVELRPPSMDIYSGSPLAASQSFWLHTLSLAPSIEQLFRNLHRDCLQRRIRRAEREQLSYERGCSEDLLNDFYRLLTITRRRHQLLPQPRTWFRNLLGCMAPNLEIRVARKEDVAIASILTLRHRDTVVYKYGCSDETFHHLAAMPLLFWRLIEESKVAGAQQIDFGRTDLDNNGLIEFKDRFGTSRRRLTYLRYPEAAGKKDVVASYLPAVRGLFSVLPSALSSRAGGVVYRHLG